jgi:hypothetical protein
VLCDPYGFGKIVVSDLKSPSDAEFYADFKNAIRFIRASIFTKIAAENNMTKSCRRHREILTVGGLFK